MTTPKSPRNLIGSTALDLIQLFPDYFPHVQKFTFVRYTVSNNVSERVSSHAAHTLIKDPSKHWQWLTEAVVGTTDAHRTVAALLAHDAEREIQGRFTLGRDAVTRGEISRYLSEIGANEAIGFCSSCHLDDGSMLHLPVLDFNIAPSEPVENIVTKSMESILSTTGVVLESGRSYHYYGLTLLTWNHYAEFLIRSLLLAPLTDTRYIAHRLLSHVGVLRLNANNPKSTTPTVVRAWNLRE